MTWLLSAGYSLGFLYWFRVCERMMHASMLEDPELRGDWLRMTDSERRKHTLGTATLAGAVWPVMTLAYLVLFAVKRRAKK